MKDEIMKLTAEKDALYKDLLKEKDEKIAMMEKLIEKMEKLMGSKKKR